MMQARRHFVTYEIDGLLFLVEKIVRVPHHRLPWSQSIDCRGFAIVFPSSGLCYHFFLLACYVLSKVTTPQKRKHDRLFSIKAIPIENILFEEKVWIRHFSAQLAETT
ncbi:MAG: hypothetical protein LBQ54_14070, partial [Planctomycetaceae bacterium]|nr:hypothetical protein [Planctomycetaceae bacterium]